jgi:hypothetical protein
MDKKKLERLEQAFRNIKKSKEENPFLLGAAVALFRPGSGVERLGQIVKITKSLLTVKWEDGPTELFGESGQEFYGEVDESGEAIKPRGDKQIWGTDEDSHLTIATDLVRQTLAEKRKKSAELRGERQAEQAQRESDPVYQKRQADLNRYAELLQGVSGSVDNSWSNQTNFRIELENIPPDQMEDLIAAIRKVRK